MCILNTINSLTVYEASGLVHCSELWLWLLFTAVIETNHFQNCLTARYEYTFLFYLVYMDWIYRVGQKNRTCLSIDNIDVKMFFILAMFFTFFNVFTPESSYCFQRVLAIAILSVRSSVCPPITRVDQSKTVQARITKSSSLAAWKTLLSGTVKLFHKFEGGHPERGC